MSLNASSFAPYVSSSSQAKAHHSYPFLSRNKSHPRTKAPPPDDPGYPSNQPSTSRFGRSSWFPTQPSTREVTSYQSGGVPTWETAIGGGSGANEEVESQMQNQWETRYGMRVDLLAAWAYVLGPVSGALPFLQSSFDLTESPNLAFCMLIMETHNDFVRFHGVPALLCPLFCSA